MSAAKTVEERIAELVALRDKIDEELVRLTRLPGPGKKRSRLVIPECGTESAYQRHKHRGEECPRGDVCKRAHAEHERVQSIVRRGRAKQSRRAAA